MDHRVQVESIADRDPLAREPYQLLLPHLELGELAQVGLPRRAQSLATYSAPVEHPADVGEHERDERAEDKERGHAAGLGRMAQRRTCKIFKSPLHSIS
jgi:hypothetical protein